MLGFLLGGAGMMYEEGCGHPLDACTQVYGYPMFGISSYSPAQGWLTSNHSLNYHSGWMAKLYNGWPGEMR